jgi:hypothetical protein
LANKRRELQTNFGCKISRQETPSDKIQGWDDDDDDVNKTNFLNK